MEENRSANPWSRYQRLWSRLIRVRWIHAGLESDEEDALLDQMDDAWSMLTPEEQVRLQAEAPRSLLRTEAHEPTRALVDVSEDECGSTQNSPQRVLLEAA